MIEQEKKKEFSRDVQNIMILRGITEINLTRRLSWSPDRVSALLRGEIALDRRIKEEVAQALGLKGPKLELRQMQTGGLTGFGALTDDELDSLFKSDIPDSYKY